MKKETIKAEVKTKYPKITRKDLFKSQQTSDLLKTKDDFKIWDRLMTDLTKSYDIPKKQILINWDIFYSKWFSKEVDIKKLKSCFNDVVKEIK